MTDFTGGTWRSLVDGSEVVAIPDSAVFQIDATEEGSTGSISTINDLIGDANLTGDATVIEDGIDGKRSFRFDGVGDLMRTTTAIASTDPQTILSVIEPQSSDFQILHDADVVNSFALRIRDDGDYDVVRGDGDRIIGNPSQLEPQLFVVQGFDDDNISLEVNGTEQASEFSGSKDLDGFAVGGRGDGDSGEEAEIDVGEILILENHTATELNGARSYLANKWGITI